MASPAPSVVDLLREGVRLAAAGRQAEAEDHYRQVLVREPGQPDALNNLANALAAAGRRDEAAALFADLVSRRPDHVLGHLNYGRLLLAQGDARAALPILQRAAATGPARADVLYALAQAQLACGHAGAGEVALWRALETQPGHVPSQLLLGAVLDRLGRLAESELLYRDALRAAPDDAGFHFRLGFLLKGRGRLDEAEPLLRRGLMLEPGHGPSRLALGFLHLMRGEFAQAMPWLEARTRAQGGPVGLPKLPIPRWQGEPLAGRNVLLWREQGFGDFFQFVRYARVLKDHGAARVGVVCQPSMAKLAATVPGVDAVSDGHILLGTYDYWTLLMDVPGWVGTTLQTIPASLPVLRAPADRVEAWRTELARWPGKKVGLVWRGAAKHLNDGHRSLAGLAQLAPLWSVPGLTFVSVQKGAGEEEARQPPVDQPLLQFADRLRDWADTAALVSALDLLITVDTAVAHLAGALGKPVWVMLSSLGTDWRWAHGRNDSPWYAGAMRLFREPAQGGQPAVLLEVAAALGEWAGHGAEPGERARAAWAAQCEAHLRRGVQHAQAGRLLRAELAFRAALRVSPDDPVVLHDLALVLLQRGQFDAAEPVCRQLLALVPGHAGAHCILGRLLARRERWTEAEQHLRSGIERLPPAALTSDTELPVDRATALSDLGAAQVKAGRTAEGIPLLREAAALRPQASGIWRNLGFALRLEGKDADAEAALRQALALAPCDPEGRFHLALHLLAQGRLAEGWPLYEARFDPAVGGINTRLPALPFPRWQGEPLAGRRLLLWPEQGFGDVLQFVRYAPLLKRRGVAHLTVAVSRPLQDLLREVDGVDAVVSSNGPPAPHDFWSMLLDLPMRLGTTLQTIPADLPYLAAPAANRKRWREALPEGPRVGLVWQGSALHLDDRRRSIASLRELAPLWAAPGWHFVSLQRDAGAEEAAHAPADQPLTPLGPQLRDFADSAAVVEQLDLVICVDTAVAHLAGALGKPVWVLLPHGAVDWRWLQHRSDSPWYPGVMRLFRQPAPGRWDLAIAAVAQALRALPLPPQRRTKASSSGGRGAVS